MSPSPYWGDEVLWDGAVAPRTIRCSTRRAASWYTSRVGPPHNPEFCKKGSSHPSAKVFPLETSTRHRGDVRSGDREGHAASHLLSDPPSRVRRRRQQHAVDSSAGGPGSGVLGWLDRKVFEETGDEAKAQGWTPFVLDTNGNGKRDDWTEPNQPLDPAKDRRVTGATLRHRRQSQGRLGLGLGADVSGLRDPRRAGRNPIRRPRLRKSTSRRCRATDRRGFDIDREAMPGCRSQAAISASSTAASARCSTGPDRERQALSGGLDALSVPRPAACRRRGKRQRGGELLHLGRSVRHVRAGPEHAVGDRQRRTSR